MDYVRQNETQGSNMVFFKAHAYGISFCLTWSMDRDDAHIVVRSVAIVMLFVATILRLVHQVCSGMHVPLCQQKDWVG